MTPGNVMDGLSRCHGVAIKRLSSGYIVQVYGPYESQREGPSHYARVAIQGSYEDAVEAAIGLVRGCLLLEPKEAS